MAVRVGAHGNSEPEESQLCVLRKTRRSPTLAIDVEPSAARYRRDGPSHGRRVEPLQAIADCVRRSQHNDLCKLPDVVVEDAVGFQVDSCNRERCRQANLNSPNEPQPTERQKRVTLGWLTPARFARSPIVMRVVAS
jgi:hypothetical protein